MFLPRHFYRSCNSSTSSLLVSLSANRPAHSFYVSPPLFSFIRRPHKVPLTESFLTPHSVIRLFSSRPWQRQATFDKLLASVISTFQPNSRPWETRTHPSRITVPNVNIRMISEIRRSHIRSSPYWSTRWMYQTNLEGFCSRKLQWLSAEENFERHDCGPMSTISISTLFTSLHCAMMQFFNMFLLGGRQCTLIKVLTHSIVHRAVHKNGHCLIFKSNLNQRGTFP